MRYDPASTWTADALGENMSGKREVLEALRHDELLAALDDRGLAVGDRRR